MGMMMAVRVVSSVAAGSRPLVSARGPRHMAKSPASPVQKDKAIQTKLAVNNTISTISITEMPPGENTRPSSKQPSPVVTRVRVASNRRRRQRGLAGGAATASPSLADHSCSDCDGMASGAGGGSDSGKACAKAISKAREGGVASS